MPAERDDTRRERQDNLVPEPENQRAAGAGTDRRRGESGPREAMAGSERDTGAGTGGATESDGRPTHHEGVHLGNQPNS
jgi:hypothetical protein